MQRTLPLAQLCISFNGNGARYIEVVIHHSGNPNRRTTLQNERTTSDRVRAFSGVSNGGVLTLDIVDAWEQ
jgi:hypothetical protein